MNRKRLVILALTILGAAGGWTYWRLVGCNTGSCPLWSNPWIAVIYGGFIGLLLGGVIPGRKKQEQGRETDSAAEHSN